MTLWTCFQVYFGFVIMVVVFMLEEQSRDFVEVIVLIAFLFFIVDEATSFALGFHLLSLVQNLNCLLYFSVSDTSTIVSLYKGTQVREVEVVNCDPVSEWPAIVFEPSANFLTALLFESGRFLNNYRSPLYSWCVSNDFTDAVVGFKQVLELGNGAPMSPITADYELCTSCTDNVIYLVDHCGPKPNSWNFKACRLRTGVDYSVEIKEDAFHYLLTSFFRGLQNTLLAKKIHVDEVSKD